MSASQSLRCDRTNCRLVPSYFYIIIPSLDEIESMVGLMKQLGLMRGKRATGDERERAATPRFLQYCCQHNSDAHRVIPNIHKVSKQEYQAYQLANELMSA